MSREHRRVVTPIKDGGQPVAGPEVELDPATRRELEAFLRECDRCQAIAKAWMHGYIVR